MALRKLAPVLASVLLVGMLVSCNGVATKNHPPLVFALNLSSAPVSLALVKDEKVLVQFSQLEANGSRPLTRIDVVDGAFLRQGGGEEVPMAEWKDPSGTPYGLRFQTGNLYAIVVDTKGQAALYSLPETYSTNPKLCLVNVTSGVLSQIQAAPDWAKNVKVYAQDVSPVVPTEFYSVDPKVLGLYWQTPAQFAVGEHSTALGSDEKPLRQVFESGRFYLFLAGDGSVRDLTPNLD